MLNQDDKPCELLARPIQTGNRIASRTAVPGWRVRTAHAGALKMPGAAHYTKPDVVPLFSVSFEPLFVTLAARSATAGD